MSGPVYRTDPPASRIAWSVDGMVILYHRPSGATHMLAEPAPEIIAVLSDGPADVATLLERLARDHAIEADEAVSDVVAARLDELEAAGLVSRA